MQAIKLTIEGEYWDSHVYAGRLYLFTIDGAITTVNWDSLIDGLEVREELRLAMRCAFSRSDYLYGQHWEPFFADQEVKSLIESKFTRLSEAIINVSPRALAPHIVSEQDNRLPFPHSDARVYGKRFYVASQLGVFDAGCSKGLTKGVSTRPKKRWDCPVLSLSTFSNTLAFAAGDEGLFEARIGDTNWRYSNEIDDDEGIDDPKSLSPLPCESCEWAFHSVFASSHVNDGFMAAFRLNYEKSERSTTRTSTTLGTPRRTMPEREFKGIVDASNIFHTRGYSWANHDKIYQAADGRINARKYNPYAADPVDRFVSLGTLELAAWKGDVVSAGVAVFGTIVECDNAIVIMLSDGRNLTIDGEPVRWRVFPRSKHYENQLHIIRDQALEIWSFNHDYFVDQTSKKSGVRPF